MIINPTIFKHNRKYLLFLTLLLHVFVPIDHLQEGYLQRNTFVINAVNDILGVKVQNYHLQCL